jgi:LacI family transcriptional regulator
VNVHGEITSTIPGMSTRRNDRSPKPATILDVAAAAGVSRQTVTRAMNDMPEVNAVTKQRVLAAAATLHYRPNRAAQRLVRGREVTVGFVVSDLRNPYYSDLASQLTRRAFERDWGLLVADVGGRSAAERIAAITGRVDAVVGHLDIEHRDLLTSQVPRILLTDDSAVEGARVLFKYTAATEEAVTHLLANGRQRIAMIDSETGPSPRGAVLRRALSARGLQVAAEAIAESERDCGDNAVCKLLECSPRPDAVLCFNDVIAISAMKRLMHKGTRVPTDIAVIGIDGLAIGSLVTPELTTLAVDMGRLAADSLDLVDAVMHHQPEDSLQRTISHTLLLRESA